MRASDLSEDIRDGIQEIANIAVGQAADKLANSFSTFVKMPIPKVRLVEAVDIMMALTAFEDSQKITAVTQAFVGEGVSGEALLLFTDANLDELARLMKYGEVSEHQQLELVLEMASLLNGTCVHGILNQLEFSVLLKHPTVFGQHTILSEILRVESFPWKDALAVEINYGFEGYTLQCDLILLFHECSLQPLLDKIQFMIE